MSSDPSIREETFPYFANEATDLLQEIEQDLLSLREDQSATKVHGLMRSAHTLKGAAATVGLETVKHVCHVLEDVFRGLYNPDIVIDDEIEALLFEGYDCLRQPLMAELNGMAIDDSDIMDRAAAVIARIQEKLGDLFDSEAAIPTAEELGFDVVQSMFEAGVEQRLSSLEAQLDEASTEELVTQVQTMAEVFGGLAESLQLPGFGQISQITLTALNEVKADPQQSRKVVEAAYANFRAGQKQVLAGDRASGGQVSPDLLALVQKQSNSSADETVDKAAKAALARGSLDEPTSTGEVGPIDETEAIATALDQAPENGLVVILPESVSRAIALITARNPIIENLEPVTATPSKSNSASKTKAKAKNRKKKATKTKPKKLEAADLNSLELNGSHSSSSSKA